MLRDKLDPVPLNHNSNRSNTLYNTKQDQNQMGSRSSNKETHTYIDVYSAIMLNLVSMMRNNCVTNGFKTNTDEYRDQIRIALSESGIRELSFSDCHKIIIIINKNKKLYQYRN